MFFQKDDDQTTAQRLEEKLWDELQSSPFMMIGLRGIEDCRTRPMTAQIDEQDGNRTIYFFGDNTDSLVTELDKSDGVIAAYTSKGTDIFAHIHGRLVLDNDPATIDRLWNDFAAAWYKDDKQDPKLALLRLDASVANIWESDKSGMLKTVALEKLGRNPDTPDMSDHRADAVL